MKDLQESDNKTLPVERESKDRVKRSQKNRKRKHFDHKKVVFHIHRYIKTCNELEEVVEAVCDNLRKKWTNIDTET